MNLFRTSCIKIPAQFESEPWCQDILRDLTRSKPSYNDPEIMITNKYYDIRDGNIMIPRYYDVLRHGHNVLETVPDGQDIDISLKPGIEFRNDLQRSGFDFLTGYNKGILQLPAGEGKTIVSIMAMCHIKKKSIFFMHKDKLVDQWIERILQVSDASEDDIGILKTKDCRDVFTKPIVLSTTQTMVSMINKLPDIEQLLWDANFGFAIWDECHTAAGAEQFSRTSLYLPCKRNFGLSATPGRGDKTGDIMTYHIGSVYKPEGESKTMTPRVVMVHFSHGTKYAEQFIYWGPRDKDGNAKLRYPKFNSSRYYSILTSKKNELYIPTLRKIAKKVYDAGRIALLLSDRIKVLDCVAGALPSHDVGFYIPRSKKKQNDELFKRFVLSTPGSARDGTDRDELDCLITANGIGNIDQSVGRVCRFRVDKQQPVVFDCVDTDYDELMQFADRRRAKYEAKGWDVEVLNISMNGK